MSWLDDVWNTVTSVGSDVLAVTNPLSVLFTGNTLYSDIYSNVTGATAANDQAAAALAAAEIEATGATDAAAIQAAAAQAGIDEQQRQFDAMQELLSPYVQAGTQSLTSQQNLAGLNGAEAQAAAINALSNSPEMAGLYAQGENALMQSGSATGGLRGGNTQAALAQFRPQMLSGLINQQYGRLGGITQMGQASAAGVGSAGMQSATNIANLLAQQGNASAGGITGAAAANAGGTLASAYYGAQANNNLWAPVQYGANLAAMAALGAF